MGRFYLEVGPAEPVWSWVLGDGLMGGVNCLVPVRPRRVFLGDPAASLVIGEMMPAGLVKDGHFRRDERRALYEGLVGKVGREGIFYRLPRREFPPLQFAGDWEEGWVTLDVSRPVAEWAAGKLPLPIFFMRRMPLFRDGEQRAAAWELAAELVGPMVEINATWLRPGWGLGPGDDHGEGHYLWAVLKVIERLDWGWPDVADEEPWRRARRFFRGVKFVEQVFGASWVGQVVQEEIQHVHDCSGD